MNSLIILFAQTKSGANLEILALLIVAGIIGYTTAWVYSKSISSRKINALEQQSFELETLTNRLRTENKALDKNSREKESEISQLTKELRAVRALHAEAVNETDEMTLKNNRTEQLLHEKDEVLIQIAQRKHLLDYKSFGTADEIHKNDLKMISGIGPFIEERLHALDIYTFKQISRFKAKDISTINAAIEYFSGRIERDEWVSQAKELVQSEEKRKEFLERIRAKTKRIYYDRIGIAEKHEADDLTLIAGIGGWIQEKLNVLDIYTFKQISRFTSEDIELVTEAIEYFPGRIERDEWIPQALELWQIQGNREDILKEIGEKKQGIYFDRLGVAHKHEANNLTLINGIGLWIEERLNTLDIYTFEQIKRFNDQDVKTITEILRISEGRIERENWIGQAKALAKSELIAETV